MQGISQMQLEVKAQAKHYTKRLGAELREPEKLATVAYYKLGRF